MQRARPCLGCGELTQRSICQEVPGGGLRQTSLCLHCLRIWQVNSLSRKLLLSCRRSLGGEAIRHLLEPPPPVQPPTEPRAVSPAARLARRR